MVLEPLDAAQREELGLDSGLVVQEVTGNPARSAGIRPGDVIVQFGRHGVDSADELERLIEAAGPGRTVPVLIQRRGNPIFIALTLPAE
jgi:serine protease Do